MSEDYDSGWEACADALLERVTVLERALEKLANIDGMDVRDGRVDWIRTEDVRNLAQAALDG